MTTRLPHKRKLTVIKAPHEKKVKVAEKKYTIEDFKKDIPEIEILNKEQLDIVSFILEGNSCFITGPAGTGKSTVTEIIIKILKQIYEGNALIAQSKKIGVTATTMFSAIRINGGTIHAKSGFNIASNDRELIENITALKRKPAKVKALLDMEVLITDEMSMESRFLFEGVDQILQIIRKDQRPYGGLQIIGIGDFRQLPPIKGKKPDQSIFTGQYCFESPLWNSVFSDCKLLTTMHRFVDAEMAFLVNSLSNGINIPEVKKLLRLALPNSEKGKTLTFCSNYRIWPKAGTFDGIILSPRKEERDVINKENLDLIDSKIVEYRAKDYSAYHRFDFSAFNLPHILELKDGADVMCTYNVTKELFNGRLGTVITCEKNEVLVHFKEMPDLQLDTITELIKPIRLTYEQGSDIIASRTQIPLVLRYARTVHKSQGDTILCKIFVLLDTVFELGQALVALSRARSFKQIYINVIPADRYLLCNEKVMAFYAALAQK